MRIGLGIGTDVARGALGFSPDLLFASGERGAWYDPGDITSLFQDAAGTTPVTADGEPVGRMLDKSGNGNHVVQDNSTPRPIYRTDGTLHWLEFDGLNDAMHAVSPPSEWAWAHQQGGATFGVAAQVSHRTDTLEFLIGTMSGSSSADTGVVLNSDNRDLVDNPRNTRVQIARGIAGQVAASFITHSGVTTKVWTYVTQAEGLRLTGQDFMAESGWMNLPTAAGDPSLTLYLGGAGGNRLQGRLYSTVVVNRALGSVAEANLRQFLAVKAGVTP